MSQSLYTAMGGISAATTALSVISNNVANINTTAFKSSSVQFSDVYSTTLSYGSVATSTSGGTNPIQVGVGTEVSAISTDFGTGSWSATGKNTDLMINGSGFFSVQATDGTTFYTRAGNFSIDENGNLVTTDGYKVLGINSNLSTHSSGVTVKIPTAITAVVSGTDLITAGATKEVRELNSTKSTISDGNFQISVDGGAATTITVDADGSVNSMIADINTQLHSSANPATNNITAVANADGTISFVDSKALHTSTITAANIAAITTGNFTLTSAAHGATPITVTAGAYTNLSDLVNDINSQLSTAGGYMSASIDSNGGIKFASRTMDDPVTVTAGTSNFMNTIGTPTTSSVDVLTFSTPTTNATNFLTQTGIASTSSSANTCPMTAAKLAAITNGTFVVTNTAGTNYTVTLTGAPFATTDSLVSAINSQLTGTTITASVDSTGGIKFASSTSGDNLRLSAGSSTFMTQASPVSREYTSNVLDQSVHITDLTSRSTSANSETINADGSLEVTYKDGSTLSVEAKSDGTYGFVFTTSDSIKINGADCVVDTSVATPANFVIQMATVTNTEGLLSVGNNLYSAGPNTGDIVYTVAGNMGCGKIASGGLEASNVDLSKELSNMILAQRAIQANSRVFTTTADIMDTITNMGR